MIRLKIVITLFVSILQIPLTAQQKQITLEDIWVYGTFQPHRMSNLTALKKTNQYTVLEGNRRDGHQIVLYDFSSLEKIKTLITTADFPQLLEGIDNYWFSDDETKILIETNGTDIYRRSTIADFYLYDLKSNTLEKISDKRIQSPKLSPDSSKIAYIADNNIVIYDFSTKKETAVTFDGKKNSIINGLADWVYEEEFGIVRAFEWNNNGTFLAYIRFDETEVPEFSMDVYGNGLYPKQEVFKYPKAGEPNSKVTLHLYEVGNQQNTEIPLNAYYIPRIKWTNDANVLSVRTLNRRQNELKLIAVDAVSKKTKTLLEENENTYVDVNDDLRFLPDNSFLWASERSGHKHLYYYTKDGKLKNSVTQGSWEVTNFYGYDPKSRTVFYQSTENGSLNRSIYSIRLDGKNKKTLATESGTNKATFSTDYSVFIHHFSSAEKPNVFTLRSSKNGSLLKNIADSKDLEDRLAKYQLPKKEFLEITNNNGDKLNAYLLKPADFDPSKKYPLLMYQYSGPGSQEVSNSWNNANDYWHFYLTQLGYVVACVDGRGTGYKGVAFKKSTYLQLGKYETEDQIAAAEFFGKYDYIDAGRIGIWGWSYGGFMSSNCILQGSDVFKTAIAVAPVTNWRFYDTVYTERYMRTPQENASGYDDNSPITHAGNLKGNYLIIHGTADDNVHVQNAMVLINSLIHKNKNFDWAIYPDKNHGIYGGYTRMQLFQKMTDFIVEKL
ncbi:MAG: S9 family peptidase [Capnocytophaga sp.]|nr:S9 family peptidase [Capnocytophaga sp.]